MRINKNKIYNFFLKNNLSQFIMTTISSLLFDFADLVPFGVFIFSLSILIILIRIGYKLIVYNKIYNGDYSLDGRKDMKKYKVIRKNIKQPQSKYSYIYNRDILPGDILLLREEDTIPCDGVILEGECLLNTNNLLGNTDHILKSSLDHNNNYFNYIENKKSLILHGMKIVKIYNKNTSKEITVLVINTGPNTFKANFFSYLLIKQDKKGFKNIIQKKIGISNLFFSLLILAISFFILCYIHYQGKNYNSIKNYFFIILGILFMPIYFILENLIKLIHVIHLNNNKIQCGDESVLPEAGYIDTVILSKSGIQPDYKILGFCPLFFIPGTKKYQ